MKAYFSYWSNGYNKIDDHLLNQHKIATYFAKKHFKEVHLITDSKSAEVLKQFNFNSIDVAFDSLSSNYKNAWSISKVFAFKHICDKGDPFIHIDYDVFLWGPLPERLLKAEVFASHKEENAYEQYKVSEFLEHCPEPYLLAGVVPAPIEAYNTGIIGGRNLDFFANYTQHVFDLVFNEKNNEILNFNSQDFRDPYPWRLATIIEQYMLAVVSVFYDVTPELLFQYWPSEKEVQAAQFTHLMTGKDYPDIKEKIEKIASALK